MTARKDASEKDEKTVDTVEEVPTSAEKQEDIFEEEDFEEYEFEADSEELEGAEGTVVESNVDGDQFDVPYVHVPNAVSAPRTSDSDDPGKSWTAQEAAEQRKDEDDNDLDPVVLQSVVQTPGQAFRVRELPDRKVVEAAGINYDQFIAGLPVRADVPHEAPRRGIPA